MNLKDRLKDLTDEEIRAVLKYLNDLQEERQQEAKEEPEHYYEFTGTWSWGVWAKSKEEAVECFNNSYLEDFDLLTDEYEVKEYKNMSDEEAKSDWCDEDPDNGWEL